MNGTVKYIDLKEGKKVYTRSIGKGIPLLLLHGGPGGTHRCFDVFEDYIDLEKYQVIFYDQLGSTHSDKIEKHEEQQMLTLERYVDEVEQVRVGLGLDKLFILGHSWGGMLVLEYALKYQKDGHLKGIINSNMNSSIEVYEKHIDALRKKLLTEEEYNYARQIEAEERHDDPRYAEIIYGKLNPESFCRLKEYPVGLQEPPCPQIYNYFQGNNEFVVTGSMRGWTAKDRLKDISVSALMIGATHDTMDPEDMKEMAKLVQNGQSYTCPNGAHFCCIDDSDNYFTALNAFLDANT